MPSEKLALSFPESFEFRADEDGVDSILLGYSRNHVLARVAAVEDKGKLGLVYICDAMRSRPSAGWKSALAVASVNPDASRVVFVSTTINNNTRTV